LKTLRQELQKLVVGLASFPDSFWGVFLAVSARLNNVQGAWSSIAQNWHKINELVLKIGELLWQCYWVGIATFDQTAKQLTTRPGK
jgi:hypothetical protein